MLTTRCADPFRATHVNNAVKRYPRCCEQRRRQRLTSERLHGITPQTLNAERQWLASGRTRAAERVISRRWFS